MPSGFRRPWKSLQKGRLQDICQSRNGSVISNGPSRVYPITELFVGINSSRSRAIPPQVRTTGGPTTPGPQKAEVVRQLFAGILRGMRQEQCPSRLMNISACSALSSESWSSF
ncbi:unnamed protein product [Nezara viridula]|uniref:Uncharacterized protein n=1 Tax=Nezara viridula TaxID=85310 RepID=A0A9P0HD44_NEZVI|nr:unnamed protein product [Nezara viridula]